MRSSRYAAVRPINALLVLAMTSVWREMGQSQSAISLPVNAWNAIITAYATVMAVPPAATKTCAAFLFNV